ncbi:ADOP family duplicated permease [Acidicapsa dinghuensis]|uniref:ADOP family duplicated permease n=1 Tax=Acidicapsa dinghuensis TaxID=2218256 RepID=A0ABW1EBD2_9BACT|nr:ABC transporter permease [Acidicapsa dinghuensis]
MNRMEDVSMDWASGFFQRLKALIWRKRYRSELDEEMAFHRVETERELRSSGMKPSDARRAAMRQFGNAEQLKNGSTSVVSFRFEAVIQDLQFAFRQLRKNPGFALTAIAILSLGIGASVAIFGFVDGALIKPLPYSNPNRVMGVYETSTACPHCNLSYQDYLDWKKQNRVFQSLDVWTGGGILLPTPAGAEPVPAARVSDGFFHTLGVKPILGRDFYPGESAPDKPRTTLLSYATWQNRFNGDRSVIGRSLTVDSGTYTIIGVLPPDFQFAPKGRADFWMTLHDPTGCEQRRSCHDLNGVGRLNDDASVATADADMKAIAARLELQYPDSNLGQGAIVLPLATVITGDIKPVLLVLLGGATLLLLIACINVASLVLVRAESRKREMAVRGALGASRSRMIGQFATEGAALVALSTLLGLCLAGFGMQALTSLLPKPALDSMPYLQGLHLNLHCVLFAMLLAVLAAALFSITPLLRLPLGRVIDGLQEGGRGYAGRSWRSLGANLVVLELATAMVLLAGAGLLSKSFYKLLHVDLHFAPDHLAMITVQAPDATYGKAPQSLKLDHELMRRISALPGVISVGLASDPPLTCRCDTTWFRILGHPWHGEHNDVPERDVTPDYFKMLRSRVISGREFTESEDSTKARTVIINSALAKQFFPNEDPIGKKIGGLDLSKDSLHEIVGVVEDVREAQLDAELIPAIYYPMYQEPSDFIVVLVRTSQSPESMLPLLSATVHQIDPGIGVSNPTTMDQQIDDSQTAAIHRSAAYLVGGFAALALLLGVVGLYGVIAYSVSQRTREIGVRMALGAPRGSVYGMILREAGLLTVLGIALGVGASLGVATLMSKLLFGVAAWDIENLTGVALLLGCFALLASFLPARRAAGVDPAEALRTE